MASSDATPPPRCDARESTRLAKEQSRDNVGPQVQALSEEIETPLNIHRWRQLEGSDPAQLEMIQKVQTLQKRLIQKTEEVVERDLGASSFKRVVSTREWFLFQIRPYRTTLRAGDSPGAPTGIPEVAEQLSVYQSSLRGKTRQMKSMASELNMYQARNCQSTNMKSSA